MCPITVEELRSRFEYEASSGRLTWRRRDEHSYQHVRWNTKYAGKVVGVLDKAGYRVVRFNGRTIKAHRVVWALTHGAWPDAYVDHIDCDRSNNRISNLRLATPLQSSQNQRTPKTNKSGFKGVCWNAAASKWQAGICCRRRKIHLGLFSTPEEAAAAYAKAAERFHGDFARTK